MKTKMWRLLLFVAVLAVGASCNDRNAEKKIAELEARLKELEGKKATGAAAVPANTAANPVIQPPAETKPEGPLPVASFAKLEHDFGTIKEGQVVEYTYTVKNTGEAPLIIQSAQPSCGCTAPDWTKTPIPVGGTGFVKAKFDSNGKPNIQNKSITVTANTWPKQTVLRFKAMVMPKGDGSNGPVK
ncbi:MAG TPA: DUF1573 domain-containing protein [Chryseosolibacter sp.]